MILGVTGSRHIERCEQKVQRLISFMQDKGVSELHHGDCCGWDSLCHYAAKSIGVKTVVHPPESKSFRAFCDGDVILPTKPYLDRNRDIVNAVDFLIAGPDGPERTRSGTWSTVRYAKKVGVRGLVWMQ